MLKFLTLCISGVMLGCIYGLIYKASGLMSFVQGDMLTLGAFLGLTFYSILGLPYWLSLLLTMLCAFAFGMLLEKGVILLGLLEILVSGYVSSAYKNLIAYVALLLFLCIKPTGLFNERAIQDV